MIPYTALLDANVLYPAPIRDLLLQLAVSDVFRAKWTADIHDEWTRSLLRNEPHRDPARIARTRAMMDQSTRDCLVEGYHALIPSLSLPDPDDRHVLAAAIVGKCGCIVTQNLKDFPAEALRPFGIESQHPDEFLLNQMTLAPGVFLSSVRKIRLRLVKSKLSPHEYLANLTRVGLVATASELSSFADVI